MQHFMELDKQIFLDAKVLTFRAWGLKASLGKFGPKVFVKGLVKPLVENPKCNFHKQDYILSKIIR